MLVFFGILLISFGLFLFFKPDLVWKIREQWKSYDAKEPSNFYIWQTKFGGIIFFIVGMGGLITGIFECLGFI